MAATGLNFPLDAKGERSTTGLNQGAFAAAVKAHSKEAFEAVEAERKWRFGYARHVVRQAQLASTAPEAALGIAKDGLGYLHSTMEFCRGEESMPLKQAMDKFKDGSFETFEVQGTGGKAEGLEVPYKGKVLRGEEVTAQAHLWLQRGVIELDTAAALCKVAETPDWTDLSDHTFVLFGAGSAMGPFPLLMALGAHVVALDLPRPQIWARLLKEAKGARGKLTAPVKTKVSDLDKAAEGAGCDLLQQTPEVRNWLRTVLKGKKKVVLGAYCYADGPLFVRVSMAMDAIIADLVEHLEAKPAVAYLCTPTDAHLCTPSSKLAAAENLRRAPAWQGLLGAGLKFAKMGLAPNRVKEEGASLPVCDAIVKEQGPNYCLAKRLQHWRAVLCRAAGCVVSSNVAPATATASVVSNKSFALAYKGMHHFKPMEVFQGETSNAVMLALLVNDLRNPLSAGQPSTALKNPMQLFSATAFHGGAWRTGYKFGTIGPCSAVAYIVASIIVPSWLVLYSSIQFFAWSWALFMVATQGAAAAEDTISIFTYLQLLEVLHAALGMVPSNPLTTAMQISSRVGLVQIVACARSASSWAAMLPWMTLFMVAWSITEVIRYLYYALNTAGVNLPPLTWLRYSTFLALYPLGVAGELGAVYSAMPELTQKAAEGCGLLHACAIVPAATQRLGFAGLLLVYVLCFPMLFGAWPKSRADELP
ncbi:unnamed protein product [Effrenium voratum]|uniref:very-long-chain (3R)-3-hydroxyacyl-CoA dehydratase n=1 Tax=Effrenium voratum TaxID=2562239 RepID=A0AA36I6F6_9DINO|nr:unnamed protein product [Effrenium voratum]